MLLTKWHSIYQIMAYERGGTCGTRGESREMYKVLLEKSEGKKLRRSLGIDLMII